MKTDAIAYGATLSACEKGGEWEKARRLVKVKMNTISPPEALELLRVMVQCKVEMNTITISAAISACEKGGEWETALGLVRAMVQGNMEMNNYLC